MSKLRSWAGQIWRLPFWVFLLLMVALLGLSHWKHIEKERAQRRFAMRVQAVEAKVSATESLLKSYRAQTGDLKRKKSAARARGGASDTEKRAFRAQIKQLEEQSASIDGEIERSYAVEQTTVNRARQFWWPAVMFSRLAYARGSSTA